MQQQIFRLAHQFSTNGFRAAQDESQVAAVALLVDGENIAADFAVHLLAHAGKFGGVSICRVYGNWAAPTMQRWQEMTTHYGMIPKHQHLPVAGKNGTDIALVVDAMDLLHSGIRRFCLASGDSDYTPLVRHLVEQGCVVVVIGRPGTAPTLQQACTMFVSTEQLLPTSARARTPASQISLAAVPESQHSTRTLTAPSPLLPPATENTVLEKLLINAYKHIVAEKGNAWVALTHLGTVLKQIDPTFTVKMYGSSTLKALIRKHATAFQVQETSSGQAHIKLKEQPDGSDVQP